MQITKATPPKKKTNLDIFTSTSYAAIKVPESLNYAALNLHFFLYKAEIALKLFLSLSSLSSIFNLIKIPRFINSKYLDPQNHKIHKTLNCRGQVVKLEFLLLRERESLVDKLKTKCLTHLKMNGQLKQKIQILLASKHVCGCVLKGFFILFYFFLS